jgi:hypothetical protein
MKLQPQSQVLSEVSVMQDSAAITLYIPGILLASTCTLLWRRVPVYNWGLELAGGAGEGPVRLTSAGSKKEKKIENQNNGLTESHP